LCECLIQGVIYSGSLTESSLTTLPKANFIYAYLGYYPAASQYASYLLHSLSSVYLVPLAVLFVLGCSIIQYENFGLGRLQFFHLICY